MGGGGGGAAGLKRPIEREGEELPLTGMGGGGGVEGILGAKLDGARVCGGLGAADGGGGGGAGGAGAAEGGGGGGGGGGGIDPDGLRDDGGGIGGFLPMGGGGFDLGGIMLVDDGLDIGIGRNSFLKLATVGFGGFGAEPVGGLGAETTRLPSGSEEYADSLFAPAATPTPVFLSFGMPPAKIPPSCGAAVPEDASSPPLLTLGTSLLALGLFAPGGAGGLSPGTGGAPEATELVVPSDPFATIGAERS